MDRVELVLKKTSKFIFGCCITLSVSTIALAANTDAPSANKNLSKIPEFPFTKIWYSPFFNLGGYYFNQQPHGAGLATLFIPFFQNSNSFVFTQGRFFPQSEGTWEGNLSLGYRHLNGGRHTMWGLSTSFDRMKSLAGFLYNQVSFNGVVWHNRWTADGNVYIPVGAKQYKASQDEVATLRQNGVYQNIYYGAGFERSLAGADLEVGNNIWRGLTVYAGGYYYHHQDAPTIAGPQANINYSWYSSQGHRILGLFNRITVETEVQHDGPRGTGFYAGVRFRINLSTASDGLSGVAKHMLDPIRRDLHITTESYHDPLHELVTNNGQAINVRSVSSKSEFEQALQDPNATVIGVNGTISGLNNEVINRSVDITGGHYEFTRNGEVFTVKPGNNGVLKAASGANLLQIGAGNTANLLYQGNNNLVKLKESEAGEQNITLEDLGLQADSEHAAILSGSATSEAAKNINLTIRRVTMDAPMTLFANGPDAKINVQMSGSTVDVGERTESNGEPAVGFGATNGGQINVNRFRGNTLASATSEADLLNAITEGVGSTVNFKIRDIANNTFTENGNEMSAMHFQSENGGQININKDIIDNRIIASGQEDKGIVLESTDGAGVTDNGSIDNNTITTNGNSNQAINIESNGEGSSSVIKGGIRENKITMEGNDDTGINIQSDEGGSNQVQRFVGANTISMNGNDAAGIALNSDDSSTNTVGANISNNKITIDGDDAKAINISAQEQGQNTVSNVRNNTVTINGNQAAAINIVAIDGGKNTLSGGVSNNTVTVNGDDGAAVDIRAENAGQNTVSNGIQDNALVVNGSSAEAVRILGFNAAQNAIGDIANNTLTANGDGAVGVAIVGSDGSSNTVGNITQNTINATEDGLVDEASVDSSSTIGGITNNTITANENGVKLSVNGGSNIVVNGFHGNQFNDAREDITLESDAQITDPSTITININDPSGTSSLSQANNNAWIHYLPDSSVLDQFVFINPTGDEVR